MKGQLTRLQDSRQALVENRLGNLGTALALLEHDALRDKQAIRREPVPEASLEELLGPVLEDLDLVRAWIRRAQAGLHETWKAGQEIRWDEP